MSVATLELPRGKQRRSILQSNARINIWHGSIRSGKTVASIIRWLDYIATGPEGELVMIGKTERTLKRNILDVIQSWVGDDYKLVQGSGECFIFGRRIYIASANDERSEGKIRGMTAAGAYGDELTLWPESIFTTLLGRLSVSGAKMFGTTNPDSPYHWLKANYLERQHELDLKQWHFNLRDNASLDPAYIAALEKEFTGLWYKRFILGEWKQAEGSIYDMWDEDTNTSDSLPAHVDYYVLGVDYATGNPCAFVLGAMSRGILHVVDEYYWDSVKEGRQKTDAEYSQDLQQFIRGRYPVAIFIDPSAASFALQLQRDGVQNVVEANNSVVDGIRVVASLLSNGLMIVNRDKCPNLLKEFASYVWDAKAQKKGQDKPLKQNDHALDALRYLAMGLVMAEQTDTVVHHEDVRISPY